MSDAFAELNCFFCLLLFALVSSNRREPAVREGEGGEMGEMEAGLRGGGGGNGGECSCPWLASGYDNGRLSQVRCLYDRRTRCHGIFFSSSDGW